MVDDAEINDQLVGQAVAGDRAALQRLLLLHCGRLTRRISAGLPRAAQQYVDDLLQQTLVEAIRDIGSLQSRSPRAFATWLQAALDVPQLRHDSGVCSVSISPDGKLLATGEFNGRLTVWDLSARRRLWTRQVDDGFLSCTVFSPDGKTIATGSASGMVKLWQVDGHADPLLLGAHRGQVICLALSPDGKMLATGGEDRIAIVWNVATGQRQQVLDAHEGNVVLVAWRNSAQLLTASAEGRIYEWDAQSGQPPRVLAELPQRIATGVLSPDKSTLAVATRDGAIRLLDSKSGTLRDTLPGGSTR